MKTSDKGIAAIMQHEGVVPGPYFDSVEGFHRADMEEWGKAFCEANPGHVCPHAYDLPGAQTFEEKRP